MGGEQPPPQNQEQQLRQQERQQQQGQPPPGGIPATEGVPTPTEEQLREAKLLQAVRAMVLEGLGPINNTLGTLTTKVEWLHDNTVTRAQLEAELDEVREEAFPGFPPGAPGAGEEAEMIDATAASQRTRQPARRVDNGQRSRDRSPHGKGVRGRSSVR